MNNNLYFLIISCVSICFTIIVICNGPVINKIYRPIPYENCKALSDEYDYYKKEGALTDSYEKSQKKK